MKYLLECPRCLRTCCYDSDSGRGPGECACGSYQNWKVLAKPRPRGFVVVFSDKGKQELRPPYWQENPVAWEKP